MDTVTLVNNRVEDGYRLIRQLIEDQTDVTAACWARLSDGGQWVLYIASKTVDEKGLADAFRAAYDAMQRLPDASITISDLKLMRTTDPIAVDIIRARDMANSAKGVQKLLHFTGQQFAGIPIDGAYIYPANIDASAVFLAQGKDAVLQYLENDSRARSGTPGAYLLARDERGNLFASIAGHTFSGSGGLRIGGKRLTVIDGVVTAIDD